MIARLSALCSYYLLAFYKTLLWLTEREIVIARSTGRNPASVLTLRQDADEYRRAIVRLELGL